MKIFRPAFNFVICNRFEFFLQFDLAEDVDSGISLRPQLWVNTVSVDGLRDCAVPKFQYPPPGVTHRYNSSFVLCVYVLDVGKGVIDIFHRDF